MKELLATLICILLSMAAVAQISDTGCGTTKACFRDPESCTVGTDCDFFLSYNDTGSGIDFEILNDKSSSSGSGWTAVGFSSDEMMGDDSVVMCIQSDEGGDPLVDNARNVGETLALSNDDTGLSGIDISVSSNVMSCVFTRAYSVSGNDNFFNIKDTNYYFFMGSGPMSTGVPLEHTDIPWISSTVLDVSSKDDIIGTESSHSDSHETDKGSNLHATGVILILSVAAFTMTLFR